MDRARDRIKVLSVREVDGSVFGWLVAIVRFYRVDVELFWEQDYLMVLW